MNNGEMVERVARAITQTLIGSMKRNPDEWMVILFDLQRVADGTRHWGKNERPDRRIRALARAAIKIGYE